MHPPVINEPFSAPLEERHARPRLGWHVITCEYPPQSGGVSDYTFLLAGGLARIQDEVHVWCPTYGEPVPEQRGVNVHCVLGKFTPRALRKAGRDLDRFPQPRRLLVQWVPHGYGYRSVNVGFCLWLWARSVFGRDQVDLMVHEAFLPFKRGKWLQNAAAVAQRFMTVILLRTARHVWISTPMWQPVLQPYAFGRRAFEWLPLPSNIPIADNPTAVAAIRNRYARSHSLIGHFGTFGPPIAPMVEGLLPELLGRSHESSALLIGGGSSAFRDRMIEAYPQLRTRVHATGRLDAESLSNHISACDLFIQPYPDGVSTRRTSFMAALSHGRPIVTTSGLLTESFWQSTGATVLAPADDREAFLASALELLESPAKRASMGESARELYRRQFDLEHVIGLLRRAAGQPSQCESRF